MTTIAEPRHLAQHSKDTLTHTSPREVVAGVDTHADTHTAAVITTTAALLGCAQFPTTPAGYTALSTWVSSYGTLLRVGIEGTGTYGAGLTRHLRSTGVTVVEVDRPDRKMRRYAGKSDPVDAEAAARAALSGRASAQPKARTGAVEAIRVLRVARRTAVTARAQAVVQIKSLIVTAPEPLRTQLRQLSTTALIATCAGLRPDPVRTAGGDPLHAAKTALRALARRHTHLSEEVDGLDDQLTALVTATNPALVAAFGVGIEVAGQLLVTAGDNPDRLSSEASFAALCGVSPIPASSGKSHRHRLNRGGDRAANCALFRVVLVRMRYHGPTRDYVARRTAQGLSKKDIIRCLKRYVARELFPLIVATARAGAAA